MGTGIPSRFKSFTSARPGDVKPISIPVSRQMSAAAVRISPISLTDSWLETEPPEEALPVSISPEQVTYRTPSPFKNARVFP